MKPYLIVGVGNVGKQYNNTRHNIGFEVLDFFVQKESLTYKKNKLGLLSKYVFDNNVIYLLKPNTFVNLSGNSVIYWANYYSVNTTDILVVVDDLALPVGKLRLKKSGSSGGHNGLKDIEEKLKTKNYPRLRFGIGNDFKHGKQSNYVLGKWNKSEEENIKKSISKSYEIIISFANNGLEKTMNVFN